MDTPALLAHLAEALADAFTFEEAGCFGLARCRRRDARWLAFRLHHARFFPLATLPLRDHPTTAAPPRAQQQPQETTP
jgi:hypothetical protein